MGLTETIMDEQGEGFVSLSLSSIMAVWGKLRYRPPCISGHHARLNVLYRYSSSQVFFHIAENASISQKCGQKIKTCSITSPIFLPPHTTCPCDPTSVTSSLAIQLHFHVVVHPDIIRLKPFVVRLPPSLPPSPYYIFMLKNIPISYA